MKKVLAVGNWKMELSHKAALEVARALKNQLKNAKAEVVVCPSAISLADVSQLLEKSSEIAIGAQNIHEEERGAFTAQTSVVQIQDFVNFCIVGHSEVRAACHDSDELVQKKVHTLLAHKITPIVCIGESEAERAADETVQKITAQISSLIAGMDRGALSRIVIAYEPIWAIGTGVTPAGDEVAEVVLLIRKLLAQAFDQQIADRIRILYGGSVKADNAAEYVGGPAADGVLVGGASVHPSEFVKIVKSIEEAY